MLDQRLLFLCQQQSQIEGDPPPCTDQISEVVFDGPSHNTQGSPSPRFWTHRLHRSTPKGENAGYVQKEKKSRQRHPERWFHMERVLKKDSQAKSGSDLERKEMLPTAEEMHNLSQEIPKDQFYNMILLTATKKMMKQSTRLTSLWSKQQQQKYHQRLGRYQTLPLGSKSSILVWEVSILQLYIFIWNMKSKVLDSQHWH